MYFTWCAPSHECYILCIAHHHHHITILCISHHHHTIVSRDICMAHHHHITIPTAHLRLAGTVLKISLGAFGAHQRQFSAARAQLTASLTPVVRAQRHGAFFGALSGVLIRGVGRAAQRHTLFLDTCVVPQLSTESEGKKGGESEGKQRKNMCGFCIFRTHVWYLSSRLRAKGKRGENAKESKGNICVAFEGKQRKNMCGFCVMPLAWHTAAESLFGFGAQGGKKEGEKKEKDKIFVIFVCTSCGELARLVRQWSGW